MMKRILVACEYSGRVRDAFRARHYEAYSCDLLPSETLGRHYQGDVCEILGGPWDLIIAHPPCTFLCNSGVRWLYNADKSRNEERWKRMEEAAAFFKMFLDLDICYAIENPIMHKHALAIVGRHPDQIIQPWMFGHGETKATCLWLNGLPPLLPTNIVPGREARVHKMPPSVNRWKERSRTYAGIAEAMAEQWSKNRVARLRTTRL